MGTTRALVRGNLILNRTAAVLETSRSTLRNLSGSGLSARCGWRFAHSCAMSNHFYKAIIAANEFDGPAVVSVYATCQSEHGVGDSQAMQQSKLAVDTRTFPVLVYDPRKGEKISERLSLQGNPVAKEDWYKDPKTGEVFDFTMFARSEGRFAKQFDAEGNPSPEILASCQERLENWRLLQELAGIL